MIERASKGKQEQNYVSTNNYPNINRRIVFYRAKYSQGLVYISLIISMIILLFLVVSLFIQILEQEFAQA